MADTTGSTNKVLATLCKSLLCLGTGVDATNFSRIETSASTCVRVRGVAFGFRLGVWRWG